MAYNTKSIATDKDGNPISQYYNPATDSYEPVEGASGANKVIVEDNSLSLIPILDKLGQLTGTVIDENTRKTNETNRINAEGIRVSQENTRKTNESSRSTAETGRVGAESGRVSAETGRVNAENTRVSQENTRKTNETARGTAESTRETNENTRKTNETTRGTNETSRVNAENTRGTNETARVSAETIRGTNESGRVSAESTRVSQENTRQTNETNRQNSINDFKVWENYNNSKTYKPLNKVAYQGSSYICILQSTGNLPTNSTYWLMIAQKGQDGLGSGDMLKSVYDTNNNGIVDKSEDANTVGGFTLGMNVPAGSKLTDTIYDDSELKYSELSSTATNMDSEGIYVNTEWRRKDNTIYAKSTLLGTSPTYNQIKIDYYNNLGATIIKSITWGLTYDGNDFVYKKDVI